MKQRRILLVVFVTIFLDLVGFGIIIPIQPFYAEAFGASPTMVTWLGGIYSLMQFLFAPFWGRLSDRFGRRPIVLMSIAVGGVGYLIFGLADSLLLLFLARALAGFGNANIGTVQAIVADVTSPEERTKGMGLIGAAFGLGFILGPALGGAFGQLGLNVPAFVAAGLAALNWGLAFFILPETNTKRQSHSERRVPLSFERLRTAMSRTGTTQILVLYLVVTTGFALMEQTLGLFIEHHWVGPSEPDPGQRAAALTTYVLLVVGVIATIIQGGLVGRLSKRFGERRLVQAGTAIQAAMLGAIPFAGASGQYGLMLVVSGGLAVGNSISNPSMSSLLSRTARADDQGGTLGLGQSLSSLGRVLGPLAAGPLFEVQVGMPFWISAGFLGAACGVALFLREPR